MKNIKKLLSLKGAALAITATTAVVSLTGCNYDMLDTNFSYNKAIVFNDNVATIINIKQWHDYDGEQIQLILEDGSIILTSTFDTKLFKEDEFSAEDVAYAIGGDDVQIRYLDKEHTYLYRR